MIRRPCHNGGGALGDFRSDGWHGRPPKAGCHNGVLLSTPRRPEARRIENADKSASQIGLHRFTRAEARAYYGCAETVVNDRKEFRLPGGNFVGARPRRADGIYTVAPLRVTFQNDFVRHSLATTSGAGVGCGMWEVLMGHWRARRQGVREVAKRSFAAMRSQTGRGVVPQKGQPRHNRAKRGSVP
jgi:hypothetical protein